MKPVRRIITMACVGALGVATFQVGASLVKDVRFAAAEDQVTTARTQLANTGDMSNIYKAVNHAMENSVVHITVTKKAENTPTNMRPQDLFRFFGPNGQPRQRGQQPPQNDQDAPDDDSAQGPVEMATGSGVIMDASGGEAWIITNNHVVADATEVDVTLNDGRRIEKATVVGTDPKSDVAVVKIKADRIIPAKWGNSDTLEKGDVIVAFGSPFGFVGSMSHGIVSALNRDRVGVVSQNSNSFAYENFIQVDAAINPGNSGGPLVNTHGEVVGINTAIASRTGSFAGIGFAIPSNQAKQVYEQIKANGRVVRGYLGVQIADIHTDSDQVRAAVEATGFKGDAGTLVSGVVPDSPALNILQLSDIITEVNGKPLKSMTAFRTEVAALPPGTTVTLKVWRENDFKDVTVKLGTQPESDAQIAMGNRGNRQQAPQSLDTLGLAVTTATAGDLEAAGLPTNAKGVLIKEVRQDSVAEAMGLQPGDLITRISATPVKTAEEAKAAFAKIDPTKNLRIDILNKQGQRMLIVPPRKGGNR
ncbi:MAG: trypsin-like peptidase domain-containing protein [Tepidisphaeraceae bacterium]